MGSRESAAYVPVSRVRRRSARAQALESPRAQARAPSAPRRDLVDWTQAQLADGRHDGRRRRLRCHRAGQEGRNAGRRAFWRAQEAAASSARVLRGAAVQPDPAAAVEGPRRAGRASGDRAQNEAQGRQAPGVSGIRRPQGGGQVQDHLCPRLRLLQIRRAERLPGAVAGAGHLPAVVRPARVRRERRPPGPDGEEHRPRHCGARRQPPARPQVPSHRLLHGRRDHVELPQIHPSQARRRSDPRPGRQLLVVRLPGGRGRGGLVRAVPAGPARSLGRPPPAVADALVEHPEPIPQLQRQGQEPYHLVQGRHGSVSKVLGPNLQGAGPAAGGARLPAPRHDGRVREVGLEPPGDGEPVRRRRGRGEGAPVARRRGPLRAGSTVAVHQQKAPLGHLP